MPIERSDWGDGERNALVPTNGAGLPASYLGGESPITVSGAAIGRGALAVNAQVFAHEVEAGLSAEARASLDASFAGLSDEVALTLAEYIQLPRGGAARPASDADLAELRAKPLGRELCDEWRGKAAKRYGRVLQFIDLVCDALSDEAERELWRWFRGQPPDVQKNILKALAK